MAPQWSPGGCQELAMGLPGCYQVAIFLEDYRGQPMKPLSPAPPRQRARLATVERESYQAIFLEDYRGNL